MRTDRDFESETLIPTTKVNWWCWFCCNDCVRCLICFNWCRGQSTEIV